MTNQLSNLMQLLKKNTTKRKHELFLIIITLNTY